MKDITEFKCPSCGKLEETNSYSTGGFWQCSCGKLYNWRDNAISTRLTPEQIKDIHYKFLTDRTLQGYNNEIFNLMTIFIPTFVIKEDETLETKYKPDDAYEIARVESIRKEYIKRYYPELIEKIL